MLLATLVGRDLEYLQGNLRELKLDVRRVLFQPGDIVDGVYFPQTAIIAQQVVDAARRPTAAALVCSDQVAGLGACLSGGASLTRYVVMSGGTAFWLDRRSLLAAMAESPRLRVLLAGCTHASIAEAMQSAVCITRHTLEERLARLLLRCLDRGYDEDELTLADDVLCTVMAAQPRHLVVAARTLQSRGVLRCRDGGVYSALDRAALQELSCECYDAIRLRARLPHSTPQQRI